MALGFVLVNGAVGAGASAVGLGEEPADLQTANQFRARLATFFAKVDGRPNVVAVGDSLIAGSKLAESVGADWPAAALPARIEAASPGLRVLNLGVEGVLFADVDCLVSELLRRPVDALVLHVNPRPFASDFAAPDAQVARAWTCREARQGPAARAVSRVADAIPVLAWRDLLQARVFGGALRARTVEAARSALTPTPPPSAWKDDEEDSLLLADALWKQRAAQRANSVQVRPEHPSHAALARMVERLADARIPAVLLYIAQDTEAIAAQLDRPHYDAQHAAFLRLVRQLVAGAPTLRFLPIERSELAGRYDDHVHLTPEGYSWLGRRIAAEVDGLLAAPGASRAP